MKQSHGGCKKDDPHGGKGWAIDPKDTFPGDYILLKTYNAGARLESRIIFLVGLKLLFEVEQSL
jgi:hypothetical protein